MWDVEEEHGLYQARKLGKKYEYAAMVAKCVSPKKCQGRGGLFMTVIT